MDQVYQGIFPNKDIGDTATNSDLCLPLMALCSEGLYTCYTCFDTGLRFVCFHLKDRHARPTVEFDPEGKYHQWRVLLNMKYLVVLGYDIFYGCITSQVKSDINIYQLVRYDL
jgi:hypothetical protein